MSEFAKFPSWRYKERKWVQGKTGVIVNNAEEEKALGEGWFDSPAKAPDREAEQAEIQRSYRERFKAAVNNSAEQVRIHFEYKTLHPKAAAADDSWNSEITPLIPVLQTQAALERADARQVEDQERRAIEAKATARLAAAPAPAEARKDTPERNTWQKKLDDPIKYEWMTIPETMRALGNCSNKTVYRKLDEGKLEYHSSVKPIRVKTVSVIRLLKEKSE